MADVSSFTFLSEAANCCRTARHKLGREHECTSLRGCAARCLANNRCRYFSHAEDYGGLCVLCTGCDLDTGPWEPGHGQLLGIYHSYARESAPISSTEALVEPVDDARLAEAVNSTLSTRCRYDAGDAERCLYKVEHDAMLSAGGHSYEYYHFLVDLIPRMLHVVHRDGCETATLLLPGYYPVEHVFRLERGGSSKRALFGWDMAAEASAVAHGEGSTSSTATATATTGTSGITSGTVSKLRSTAAAATTLFGPRASHRLQVNFTRRRAQQCEAPGHLIPFTQYRMQWGLQPAAWFRTLRAEAWAMAEARPPSCASGSHLAAEGSLGSPADWRPGGGCSNVLIIQRLGSRRFSADFLANATAFLDSRGFSHRVVALEALALVEQVCASATAARTQAIALSSLSRAPICAKGAPDLTRSRPISPDLARSQVRLFASSTLVIGLHGAGLSNLMFSPPGSAVVELGAWGPHDDGRGPPPCFPNLAHRLGLRYHRHPRHAFSPRLAALVGYYAALRPRGSPWPPLPPCDGWCGSGLPPAPERCGRPRMSDAERRCGCPSACCSGDGPMRLVCEPYIGTHRFNMCVPEFTWQPQPDDCRAGQQTRAVC